MAMPLWRMYAPYETPIPYASASRTPASTASAARSDRPQ